MGQVCQWRQELPIPRFTAMTVFVVLGSVLVVSAIVATVRAIRSDGYRREPTCDAP
jgi:hypothetical protein